MPRNKYLLFTALLLASSLVPNLAAAQKLRQIAILDLPGRPGFDSVVFANGKLVIAHHGANQVEVFDPQRRRLAAEVTGIQDPRGMSADVQGNRVYIATATGIAVLNTKDWKVENILPTKNPPENILFVPQTNTIFTTSPAEHMVSAISADHGSEVASFDVQGRPEQMAWDPQNGELYVTVQDRAEILALNPQNAQNPVARHGKLSASQPTGILLDAASRRLYVAVRYAVLQLDADSFNEISRVPGAAGTDGLWLDGPGNTLYATAADGTVNIISVSPGKITSQNEYRADVRGHAFAYDSENKLIFMPGGREGRSKLVILKQVGGASAAPVKAAVTAQK